MSDEETERVSLRDRSFRKPMVWAMALGSAAFVALDVWAALTKAKGDTISEIVLKASLGYFAIPFGYGVLAGHLFWPGHRFSGPGYWVAFASLIAICAVLAVLPGPARALLREPIVALLIGLVAGHFLWAQELH